MELAVVRTILRSAQIGYVIADRHWNVVMCGGATHVLDVDPTCVGESVWNIVPELVGSESGLLDVLDGRLPSLQLEHVDRSNDSGIMRYVTLDMQPYVGAEGEAQILIIATDQTQQGMYMQMLAQQHNELRLLQNQLAQQNAVLRDANTELQRLDEVKTTFTSVAAHELRSPLTSIVGYVDLLLDGACGPLSDDQQQSLQIIQQSARRLQTITTDLLDVARIDAGRIEMMLAPTDIGFIAGVVITEHRPQLSERRQTIILDVDHDLPLVVCDATRVTQIIGNLVDNASKYTPNEGCIELTIRRSANGEFVHMAVADNGIGIAPKDQANLFLRFFRIGGNTGARVSGTGLGLYITRSLVELHGGRIWVGSELHQGSTFHVLLPIGNTPATFVDGAAAMDGIAQPLNAPALTAK